MGSSGAAVHWTCCAPARDAGGLGRITGGHGKPALWGPQLRDWLMVLKYCLTDILLIYTMQRAKFWWSHQYHQWISTLKMFGPLKPWKVLNFSNSTFVMFVEFWWILLNCVQFYCLGVPNFLISCEAQMQEGEGSAEAMFKVLSTEVQPGFDGDWKRFSIGIGLDIVCIYIYNYIYIHTYMYCIHTQ